MAPKRYLLIRLSSIGDVLHCTPALRALRQTIPEAHITWVVGEVAAPLLKNNPFVDEVYIWPRERWEASIKAGRLHEAWALWQKLSRDLKNYSFDIALDVHGLLLSGLIAKASGAPRIIGMAHTRELNSWFMTDIAPARPGSHVIERYLSVLRPLGIAGGSTAMTLVVDEESRSFAEEFLRSRSIFPTQPIVTLIPATSWITKNWPPEYFAALANSLDPSLGLMLCGSQGDRAIADAVMNKVTRPVIDAVGQTNLLQTAALLSRSKAVVTGDTGSLHMAVALGVPTVSLFGASDPARFGPLTGSHIVLTGTGDCRSCFKAACRRGDHRCMHSITPRRVLEALRRLVAEQKKTLPQPIISKGISYLAGGTRES